jgi:hypothetical protein
VILVRCGLGYIFFAVLAVNAINLAATRPGLLTINLVSHTVCGVWFAVLSRYVDSSNAAGPFLDPFPLRNRYPVVNRMYIREWKAAVWWNP